MELLVMRLEDMGKIHPQQDNSHVCSKCGKIVGIYPSGQAALREYGNIVKIICNHCVELKNNYLNWPAAPVESIIQEIKESKKK